jgi:hypothetical protein
MDYNQRKQIIYQKTDYNSHSICQLSNIVKCCKCKKNNTIPMKNTGFQYCLFCGTPNYIKPIIF